MTQSSLLLLVDDTPGNLDILVSHLEGAGYDLAVALSGEDALNIVENQVPSLVLLDVMMPGIDGFQTCLALKKKTQTKDVPIIFMSALTDTESKVRGFAVGGVDFVTKPFQREEVLSRINTHLTIQRQHLLLQNQNNNLQQLNQQLQHQIDKTTAIEKQLNIIDHRLSALTQQEALQWGIDAFIGHSPMITSVLQEVRSLQHVDKTNVLVLGESGTGKELISRAIHFGSNRKNNPFIAVNCSAIPTDLADSEFFGHIKGAFTGASRSRTGHFIDANGGTLFLDEIGDMPLALQAKLLRVLEDGQVTPVGGNTASKVNVRIVSATNMDLREKIKTNLFRQDLYFRLAGYAITLPPLRKRVEDIPPLATHFLQILSSEMGKDTSSISDVAISTLQRYDFPGNVRELRNIMEHALISCRKGVIQPEHLHFIHDIDIPDTTDCLPNTCSKNTKPQNQATSTNHDEDTIITYIQKNDRIDNSVAQTLLNVEHARASYLLKKLLSEGRIFKQGERRWAYYTLK
ncbi:hypothetical protein A9Q81_19320 [Gammaproteobacteria bacterium 42_54_T18]|nr:hypothetical protein A9Q81_19320 [Gammaproteobacteria bacterium 42_54_T18]